MSSKDSTENSCKSNSRVNTETDSLDNFEIPFNLEKSKSNPTNSGPLVK